MKKAGIFDTLFQTEKPVKPKRERRIVDETCQVCGASPVWWAWTADGHRIATVLNGKVVRHSCPGRVVDDFEALD